MTIYSAGELKYDEIKRILDTQEEFDKRIKTINKQDTKMAYLVEVFEWYNTIELFKNWKQTKGKPRELQLEELADVLAFGASHFNQSNGSVMDIIENSTIVHIKEEDIKPRKFMTYVEGIIVMLKTEMYDYAHEIAIATILFSLPIAIARMLYTKEELFEAYYKKMKTNHERQDGGY